jgi:hypothetical protein
MVALLSAHRRFFNPMDTKASRTCSDASCLEARETARLKCLKLETPISKKKVTCVNL